MSKTILLVGAGNMGFAMLKGWVKDGAGLAFHVVDPSAEHRSRAEAIGVASSPDLSGAPVPDLIVLAVKPQILGGVAEAYRSLACPVVSVAAGVTLERLAEHLGPRDLIRVMPNTPAAIGQGMSVACGAEDPALRALVSRLMSAVGQVAWIEEEGLMDAVTAISGSGPAYLFHFIECLAAAGEKLGLTPDLALQLAKVTVAGAGALAEASEDSPATLREQVTSPGGTTAAALGVLRDTGALGRLMDEATTAARDRGRTLG